MALVIGPGLATYRNWVSGQWRARGRFEVGVTRST